MNIKDCTAAGISVAASAAVTLTVEDTRISECVNGIQTTSSGGLVTADYSRVSIWGNTNGVNAQNGSRVLIHNSTLVANAVGVNQSGLAGFGSVVTVFGCAFSGNGNGVQSIGGATAVVSTSVFATNTTALNPNGGSIASNGDNIVNGAPGLANGGAATKI